MVIIVPWCLFSFSVFLCPCLLEVKGKVNSRFQIMKNILLILILAVRMCSICSAELTGGAHYPILLVTGISAVVVYSTAIFLLSQRLQLECGGYLRHHLNAKGRTEKIKKIPSTHVVDEIQAILKMRLLNSYRDVYTCGIPTSIPA